jgi:hypothetical protein
MAFLLFDSIVEVRERCWTTADVADYVARSPDRVPRNGYELGPPKTKKSVRTIGVPSHLLDAATVAAFPARDTVMNAVGDLQPGCGQGVGCGSVTASSSPCKPATCVAAGGATTRACRCVPIVCGALRAQQDWRSLNARSMFTNPREVGRRCMQAVVSLAAQHIIVTAGMLGVRSSKPPGAEHLHDSDVFGSGG